MSLEKTVHRSYTLHQRTKTVDVMTNVVVTEEGKVIADQVSASAYTMTDRARFLSDTAGDAQSSSLADAFGMVD